MRYTRRDEQHCSVITGQRQHHRVRRQHHSLAHHSNSTDTCHQQWNIRSDSRISSPGQAYAWLSSSATTLFSSVLCASKFCPCRENFLSQWHNHVGTQSTHVECCSGDTSLLEMQFSIVSTRCRASHCRSYDSSLYACSTLWLELFFMIDDDDDKWQ